MKRFFLIIAVSFLAFAACNKEGGNEYTNAGELTGWDSGFCPCCGNLVLQIDNTAGDYRIESLPGMSAQDFQAQTFPKRIRFNFQNDRNCSGIQYVLVTSYKFE
jgi:hypothetical protein